MNMTYELNIEYWLKLISDIGNIDIEYQLKLKLKLKRSALTLKAAWRKKIWQICSYSYYTSLQYYIVTMSIYLYIVYIYIHITSLVTMNEDFVHCRL